MNETVKAHGWQELVVLLLAESALLEYEVLRHLLVSYSETSLQILSLLEEGHKVKFRF